MFMQIKTNEYISTEKTSDQLTFILTHGKSLPDPLFVHVVRLNKTVVCFQHSIFISICMSCLTAFHLSLHSFSVALTHCFLPRGCCGYACLHLCVFVSVITIASCAADKSPG